MAFGTVGAMEGVARYTRRTPALPVDLSEAHLFYCHGYNAGARCNTGWWPDQALNAARDIGVTFDNYYPYTAGDQACTGLNADWPNHLAKVSARAAGPPRIAGARAGARGCGRTAPSAAGSSSTAPP